MEALSNRGIALIVVAGGVGFIGSAQGHFLAGKIGDRVVNNRKLSGAGGLDCARLCGKRSGALDILTRFLGGRLCLIGA
jgi:hypothetical protein